MDGEWSCVLENYWYTPVAGGDILRVAVEKFRQWIGEVDLQGSGAQAPEYAKRISQRENTRDVGSCSWARYAVPKRKNRTWVFGPVIETENISKGAEYYNCIAVRIGM